jgi:hypothetical protein
MTKQKHVWILIGCTGEYSDYREWNAKAFSTKEETDRIRALAQEYADKIYAQKKDNGTFYYHDGCDNPHDPDMIMDYNGTTYRIEMLELE